MNKKAGYETHASASSRENEGETVENYNLQSLCKYEIVVNIVDVRMRKTTGNKSYTYQVPAFNLKKSCCSSISKQLDNLEFTDHD